MGFFFFLWCVLTEGSYPLLCKICRMILCSWVLLESGRSYVFILLTMYCIAACLCSGGWHDALWIMVSVAVGFLYMLKVNLSVSLLMVISRKFNWLLDSVSIVNFRVGESLLKALNTSCMLI
jgi:hypothetical protein